MLRVFFIIIISLSAFGCVARTQITPRTALAVQPCVENTERIGLKKVAHVPPLTPEEREKLEKRLSRHSGMDRTIVPASSDEEYECESDDWTCTEDTGAWLCYCKARQVE